MPLIHTPALSLVRVGLAALVLLAVLWGATPGHAAEPLRGPVRAAEADRAATRVVGGREIPADIPFWDVDIRARSTYFFRTDFEGQDGSVDLWANDLKVSTAGPCSTSTLVGVDLYGEHRHYEFSGLSGLVDGATAPFERLVTFSAGIDVLQRISGDWGFFGKAIFAWSVEEGRNLGDGFSLFALGGIGKQFGDRFRAGVGLIYFERLDDSAIILPAVQFEWKARDDLKIALTGLDLQAEWEINPRHTLTLSGSFDTRRFRLKSGAPANGAVFVDRRIPVTLRYGFRPRDWLLLEATVGVNVWRELELRPRSGNARFAELEPGAFVGLSVTFTL